MTDLQLEDVKKTIRAAFKNQFGFAPSTNSIAVLEGSYDHEHEDGCTWFELIFSVGGKSWYHSTGTGELKRTEWMDQPKRSEVERQPRDGRPALMMADRKEKGGRPYQERTATN